jgi:signal transduction histidine kinase
MMNRILSTPPALHHPVEVDASAPDHSIAATGPDGHLDYGEMAFLIEATRVLSDTLELEPTLKTLARLSLPRLGSWCIVDLLEGDRMHRLAIIHPDPEMQSLADELLAGWPPRRDDPLGIPSAIRTRRSEVVSPVTDEMLVATAGSAENRAILCDLQIGSFMTVPLVAHGIVLGAITYVSPNSGDSFSERDLALAEGLAARCAIAVEHAWLLQKTRDAEAVAGAAQVRAEEANLVKMRFLSTMSHELRTPLNAIAGYAELLETGLRGPLTDAQAADVRRIQANQRHLLGLVESVLSYAKIDSGRIEFGLEDVALPAVIEEVDGVIAPVAAGKGIVCLGCVPEAWDDLTVYADRDKLRQILINLMANAIKFSSQGGRVDLAHRLAGNDVQIRISDNGIGIAPEYRDRIFEPFVQVEENFARRQEGTGLGLAISRELAIGMGGSLSVESELGCGSTFTLTLPRGRG